MSQFGELEAVIMDRLRAAYATPGGATVARLGLILAGAVLARIALTVATQFTYPWRGHGAEKS
jgi:hypothetical protein